VDEFGRDVGLMRRKELERGSSRRAACVDALLQQLAVMRQGAGDSKLLPLLFQQGCRQYYCTCGCFSARLCTCECFLCGVWQRHGVDAVKGVRAGQQQARCVC
jgi:hypothetical protein